MLIHLCIIYGYFHKTQSWIVAPENVCGTPITSHCCLVPYKSQWYCYSLAVSQVPRVLTPLLFFYDQYMSIVSKQEKHGLQISRLYGTVECGWFGYKFDGKIFITYVDMMRLHFSHYSQLIGKQQCEQLRVFKTIFHPSRIPSPK